MTHDIKAPKKLIETALPLNDINAAAVREKSIRHGHPSTLHLWWARRPLAVARAVIFAQMVNDPGYERALGRGINKKEAEKERERLFEIIRKLVLWENTNNEAVLGEARAEIWKSWRETCALNRNHPKASEWFDPERLPAFHDPFAGGGALPLEAQRLGLEAYASDLNPVAVLINKAMIEIPPKFSGRAPVGPLPQMERQLRVSDDWNGAAGLAEDVRRYGHWMREQAYRRIGHLYPEVEVTRDMAQDRPDLEPLVGKKLTVIAWLWARTVKSPNPAYSHVHVPLASTFMLSTKLGKEAYVEPVVEGDQYRFVVKTGAPPDPEKAKSGTKLARGSHFRCIVSNSPIEPSYIYHAAKSGGLGTKMMAVVLEGEKGRLYLPGSPELAASANQAPPTWVPDLSMPENPRWFSPPLYGLKNYGDLFTPRQLTALNTFSDLVSEAREKVKSDALAAGWVGDGLGLDAGGNGATAYADAVAVYLAFAVDKGANYWSTLCSWHSGRDTVTSTFGRQALPMVWDFAEANPLSKSSGNFLSGVNQASELLRRRIPASSGHAYQEDAASQASSLSRIISTDPPYYDNIGYADLSDFFYVWLRRSLKPIFPGLFSTLATPKAEELVATPYRHGNKEAAEKFFLDGMTQAMERLAEQAHPAFSTTIYYAFKQSELKKPGAVSTGWETFLEAVLRAGFCIAGTWPVRTELIGNLKKVTNALASSIILVCRKRNVQAATVTRREFLRELNAALPEALADMTRGEHTSPVAPVDLAQAIIGPGMEVFSKYAAVLEADGKPMTVRTALQLINRFLAEEDFDRDTQFCLHWFETHHWAEGRFGEADVLARAKGTSVEGVARAGVVESGKGAVRLLRHTEYPLDWDPETDRRCPIWEALHHLVRILKTDGEAAAGRVLDRMKDRTDALRQLAYRLYALSERKSWGEDARTYNELINSWQGMETLREDAPKTAPHRQDTWLKE